MCPWSTVLQRSYLHMEMGPGCGPALLLHMHRAKAIRNSKSKFLGFTAATLHQHERSALSSPGGLSSQGGGQERSIWFHWTRRHSRSPEEVISAPNSQEECSNASSHTRQVRAYHVHQHLEENWKSPTTGTLFPTTQLPDAEWYINT